MRKIGENMDSYTSFAQVYDLFMDNVPYEEWCEYIRDILHQYGIEDGLLLDLGCGTGKMCRNHYGPTSPGRRCAGHLVLLLALAYLRVRCRNAGTSGP